ncbi:MAG: hypothetical protein GKR98_07845 [Boseongicola sp.]|nr:MAG: hypothetical protein GKR98_07845 [Boseongicola sp.]
MDGVTFAFVLLPCLGAVTAGYLNSDWRLAGALAAGGFALLLVVPGSGGPLGTYVLPGVAGAAVAGLVLLPYLRWQQDTTIWGRMMVSLVAVVTVAFVNLFIFTGLG